MLRNKYVIAALGAMLLLVVAYNVSFFVQRSAARKTGAQVPLQTRTIAGSPRPDPSVLSPAMASRPAEEWRRDPFWYPHTKQVGPVSRVSAQHPASGLRLEATMPKDGGGTAVISGQIVGVGEQVGGFTVAEIGDLFVRLKGPGGIKKLSITTDASVKE